MKKIIAPTARAAALSVAMAAVACWWAASASAQYGSEVDVNAVIVPVTVRDSKGRVVKGVARNKFHLSVDGYLAPAVQRPAC